MKNLLCFQKLHTSIKAKARLSSLYPQEKCEFLLGEHRVIKPDMLVQPRDSLFTLLFPNVLVGWSVRVQLMKQVFRDTMTALSDTSLIFCPLYFTRMWMSCCSGVLQIPSFPPVSPQTPGLNGENKKAQKLLSLPPHGLDRGTAKGAFSCTDQSGNPCWESGWWLTGFFASSIKYQMDTLSRQA